MMDGDRLDIRRLRAETPGCGHVLHFNNAGASLMPVPVIEAMNGVLHDEVQVGGYEAERRASDQLAAFYTEFAALLQVEPSEVAYVENATRAWDMAFYGLQLEPGDRILTHGSEYVSNYLAMLHQAKRRQLEIDVVPSDASGQIDCEALEKRITPRTRLIAITHVPTQGGLVNPAEEVGSIARKHGLIYMLDACQSVGQIDVDVRKIGCHVLSGTGRKFLRGPRGTGFLYVANDMIDRIDPPFIDLRAATWTEPDRYELAPGAKRFENWESNVAGRVGLAAAVRYARAVGMDRIAGRVAFLAEALRERLAEVKGVTLHDLGSRKSGIVTFRKGDLDPTQMAAQLREVGINVSVSALAYARLDLGARGLPSLLRASVHYFNTEAEIDTFAGAIAKL
jgi:cysteine desulfurase / selenocysteine lyase